MNSGQRASGYERAEVQQAVRRARHAVSQARVAAAAREQRESMTRDLFALPVRECAYRCLGRPVRVLRAGALTPAGELGLDQLRASGFKIAVLTVEPGAAGLGPAGTDELGEVRRGDLRTIALPPRSFDVVHCALLLDRITHVELVLDRLTAALRPGGLFLLRIRDRDCAAARLERRLPRWARRLIWARLDPGRPGPFPAVYEKMTSDRGVQAYLALRGLAIVRRQTAWTLPAGPGRVARGATAACGLLCWLTRGRASDTHDEVLYVIRKPEDRFARVM